jgi:hypothetical protein
MESLQWFILGIITMLAIQGMVYVSMVIKLKWYAIPILVTGVVLVLFGIAWAGSSFLEGYPQSAAMGLTLFGGTGLIVAVQAWRLLVAPGLKKTA